MRATSSSRRERRRLSGRLLGRGQRPDRGEVTGRSGCSSWKTRSGSVQIAQRVLAEVAQSGLRGRRVAGQLLGGQREEHLPAVAGCKQAGESVDQEPR